MYSKIVLALPLLATVVTSAPSFQFPFFKSVLPGPPGHKDVIDLSKYTIGEILDYTLKHHDDETRRTPPLKKLAWVVNRTESFKEFVHKSDISVTLFAPDDEALTPPHRDGDHGHEGPGHHRDHGPHHEHEHNMMATAVQPPHIFHSMIPETFVDDGNDDDDEEKHRKLAIIVNAILYYHTGAKQWSKSELLDKQTIPTLLNQTKDTDVAFRIRTHPRLDIFPPPPSYDVSLNFYAKTRAAPAIQAKNGIIYLVSAPLLPPLTPFDQLLEVPTFFSTFTSGVQLTELDRSLAPWIHYRKDTSKALESLFEQADEANPVVMELLEELTVEARSGLPSKDDVKDFPITVFAPSNRAFFKIPFQIKAFLFSPFGRGYLKKLLSFHIVPNVLFHSDYIVNATHKDADLAESFIASLPEGLKHYAEAAGFGDHKPRHGGKANKKGRKDVHKLGDNAEVKQYELATLLGNDRNGTLEVNVYTSRLAFGKGPVVKQITVGRVGSEEHERAHVVAGDATAWGGAIHVLGSLLSPYNIAEGHEHHHGPHHGHDAQLDYFQSLFA